MDPKNAIELHNVTKSFKIQSSNESRKSSILSKNPTKTVNNIVIDDMTLNIRKGEVVGIIGRNGSGKSTFLSLLARIMEPDSGTIERSGKIASILELGMGFHPDMSGRENIYIKSEMYGFSKKEIDSKIDTIIEYSGIAKYIDNPVRTYSSGMSGRLAFAIMVNVDSDIMLVDEILSVGDSSFELKAREHFKQLAKSGKTVIIVSHQLSMIESMCSRTIWIDAGKIYKDGPSKIVCAEYINTMSESPDIIIDLANAGVAESQYKLALMYRDGVLIEKNLELFEEWIQKAADQGHSKAQVVYGDILFDTGDIESAIALYQSAANKGDNEAKIKFSSLCSKSNNLTSELITIFSDIAKKRDGVSKYRYADLLLKCSYSDETRKQAHSLFEESALEGYSLAYYQLALMSRDGIGTPKDMKEMECDLIKGVDLGHIQSIVLLADIYSSGWLLPRNEEKAFSLYLKAASLGNGPSMFKVANCYKDGKGTDVDIVESEKWFTRFSSNSYYWNQLWAVEHLKNNCADLKTIMKYHHSASVLGSISSIHSGYTSAIINDDFLEDKQFYFEMMKLFAESGNIEAIKRLGNYYYDGIGLQRDYTIAFNYYSKGAAMGDSWCCNKVGEMYREGKGTDKSMSEAIYYFNLASDYGNIGSIVALIGIYGLELHDDSLLKKQFDRLKSIANCGSVDAIRRVANYYYEGVIVPRDYSVAIQWYTKAARLGDSWSRIRLAEMYRDGKGTNSDAKISAYWFNSY